MQYAKLVFARPLEGPFDYIIPSELAGKVRAGMRAWVDFGGRRSVGFVAGVSDTSSFPRLKPLVSLIDTAPVLSRAMRALTKELAQHYCVSLGEAIAASLPQGLRKGRPVEPAACADMGTHHTDFRLTVLQDLDGSARLDVYVRQILACHSRNQSVIVLAADSESLKRVQAFLSEKTGLAVEVLERNAPQEIQTWEKIRMQPACVVLGLRSAVFAPVNNLGLIIVDKESASAFKQDQSPHYHARWVAHARCRIERAVLILADSPVSLESFALSGAGQQDLQVLPRTGRPPEISVVDMKTLPLLDKRKKIILSRTLQDDIARTVEQGGKALLFLNRKGFATVARCSTCARTLQCPRCAINLVYYFADNSLRCRYCNYSLKAPKVCPQCNSGYLKYSGAGTEKIESELARIFPASRIQRLDAGQQLRADAADIFISTQSILQQPGFRFDVVGALGVDNGLNRVDFRAAEKTFGLLWGLANLAGKKLFIQTGVPAHPLFSALAAHDPGIFYNAEFASRKQLGFPPVRDFIQIRLRGKNEEKVHAQAQKLYELLSAAHPPRGTKLVSLNPGEPAKLRGNFYWAVLLSTGGVEKANAFLKKNLKQFRSSGIIVTVDVDPV